MDVMVYSPRRPCGTGYPSCGFVVFQLCVRAREEGEPAPLFCGTGWFSLLPMQTHTHTHHVFVNVWPFYLPTPLLSNKMVFPCALRHTHTHHVSVYVWHSLSVHALLLSLRSILWCAGQAGYDTGCGTPVVGVLQASRLQALVFGGIPLGRGGGGAENAQRTIFEIFEILKFSFFLIFLFF